MGNKLSQAYYIAAVEVRTKWYVFANRSEAAIYLDGTDRRFHLILRLTNRDGRAKERDLDSDRPGRNGSSNPRGIYLHRLDRRHHRHEVLALRFAAKIAKALTGDHYLRRFDDLVLIAEPHFLGLIRSALGAPVRECITQEIGREYDLGSASVITLRSRVMTRN